MKRFNDILSYWWLLLLLLMPACSDSDEPMPSMNGDDEVELTIQSHVPEMSVGSRAVSNTISTITALAFDESSALIKTVNAILSNTTDTTGTMKIKVPTRTRSIHFLTNGDAEDVTTIDALKNKKVSDMTALHYWGMAAFADDNALKAYRGPLIFYRNMAKVSLVAGNDDYIAGFLNYTTSGMLVPYSNDGFDFGSKKNYITLPAEIETASHAEGNLGKEYYLFEHANDENDNPLYAICNIGGKFYKIAFATSGTNYYDIIRNRHYRIVIDKIDESYAEDSYDAAVSAQPINDLVIEDVDLTVTPKVTELESTSNNTCTVTVDVPEGVTELTVNASDAFTVTSSDVTITNGTCDVTSKQGLPVDFTLTVKNEAVGQTGAKTISFTGRGKYKRAEGSTSIRLYQIENVNFNVSANPSSIIHTATSTTQVTVGIPEGITSLTVDAGDAFTVTSSDVTITNGTCDVTSKQGQPVDFTLALKADGTVGAQLPVTFTGSGTYKRATGSVTITLKDANTPVSIEATPYVTSLNYSANSVSDLIVNVTIPREVSTLSFESEYFDVAMVIDTLLTKTSNGSYTVVHPNNVQTPTTTPIRLRLKTAAKTLPTPAGFTFNGTGEGVTVTPDTVNNITLSENGDEYVRWQGDVLLEWGVSVTQIPLSYSWFEGIPVGSKLRVEYETTAQNDAVIQFAECNGDWNTDGQAYFFPELDNTVNYDGNQRTEGLNLNNATGIYEDTFKYLTLTEDVLTKMQRNRTNLLGETDIVMAIQGGNVRLKRISVIPASNNNNEESIIFNESYSLNEWNNPKTFSQEFAPGTRIIINFSQGGTIKLCTNGSQYALKIPIDNDVNRGPDNNLYMSFSGSKEFVVDVNANTQIYTNGDGSENSGGDLVGNLSNTSLNGLTIEGTGAVLTKVTVINPQ